MAFVQEIVLDRSGSRARYGRYDLSDALDRRHSGDAPNNLHPPLVSLIEGMPIQVLQCFTVR